MLLWLTCLLMWGQDSVTVLDMRSGLSENRIRAICQMADGRMAIATTATVEVYDGTRFHSFSLLPELAYPLPEYTGKRQLTCDSVGRIYLRNDRTLYVIDARQDEVVTDVGALLNKLKLNERDIASWPVSPVFGGDTTAMVHDSYGGLWIGTKESGIIYTNVLRARQFVTTTDSFAYQRIPNFVSARASQLSARYAPSATNCTLDTDDYSYLGTREGVFVINRSDSLVAVINETFGLLTNNIASLLADHRGDVWVATAGGGITRLHKEGRDSFSIVSYGLPDGILTEGREFRTCQIHHDASSGLFTIGFVGGTVVFHPDSIKAPRYTFHYPAPLFSPLGGKPDSNKSFSQRWTLLLLVLTVVIAALFLIWKKQSTPITKSAVSREMPDIRQTVEKAVLQANEEVKGPTADEQFLEKLQKTVEQHLSDEDFSVAQLSDLMAMDRTVLYRRMQQLTATSPSVYIKQIRMQVAARLLSETELSLSDIAMKTGFSTTKYFSAAFKDFFGKTPGEYRKEVKRKDYLATI